MHLHFRQLLRAPQCPRTTDYVDYLLTYPLGQLHVLRPQRLLQQGLQWAVWRSPLERIVQVQSP